jgi:predicted TIM-barrel fold metal-dependent hydrolase
MQQILKIFLRCTFMILVLLAVAGSCALCTSLTREDNLLAGQDQKVPKDPVSAISPFLDAHTHLDPTQIEHSIQAALQAITRENAAKIVLMPPPFTADDPTHYDADLILAEVKGHADKLAVLGGGGTLNAMIQESVRSGDAGAEVRRRFKKQAEELLHAGVAGFGEMAAEHFQGATAYQYAPPDHPLFLLLADIAAEHGVPIDLHMEALPRGMPLPPELKSPPNPPQLRANIFAFERLLAHNPRARVIWAHAGSDNTSYRTPELCRRLLTAHANLYMELKIDPANPGKNSLLTNDVNGPLDPDWLQLFQDFPDRFVIGTDQHYPEPQAGQQRWEAMVLLLNQLPAELRKKIGMENATRLYSAPSGRSR